MMEESPKLIIKQHRGRLSMNTRSRLSDSPKTPIRISSGSPDVFQTPPHSISGDASYSTPLNRRKRTCFAEESPSQDHDSSSLGVMLSQDFRQSVIDVDWKWEDQVPITKKTSNKPKMVEKLKAIHSKKRTTKHKSPEITQKKGFYKFKEELMKNMESYKPENEEQDSSLKENKEISIQNNKPRNSPRKHTSPVKETVPDNFLDDSDVDNLLLMCSQKAEASYHKQVKRKKENDSSINIAGEMDSVDEMLLSIPVDDKYIETLLSDKKQSTDNTSGYGTSTGQGRSSFTRHNSMPTFSPQSKFLATQKKTAINLVRHNSMPTDEDDERAGKNKCLLWTSSSSESISPDKEKRRCTQEEIKRKRLEALQRREASKQKKTSLYIQSAINVRNKIINSKKDKG